MYQLEQVGRGCNCIIISYAINQGQTDCLRSKKRIFNAYIINFNGFSKIFLKDFSSVKNDFKWAWFNGN